MVVAIGFEACFPHPDNVLVADLLF